MQKFTRLLSFCLFVCGSLALRAAVPPFRTTVLTNGNLADTTSWYTMTIGAGKFVIAHPGNATSITANHPLEAVADSNLWCFVGNAADGYTIYNKAAGAGKVLASPVAMSGTTGSTAYVVLKDTASLGSDYVSKWDVKASTFLTSTTTTPVYLYQHGSTTNAVNLRDAKLAFWTGGTDAGSTLLIELGEKTYPVNMTTGSRNNPSGTYFSIWTATDGVPGLLLRHSNNNMNVTNNNLNLYTATNGNYTLIPGVDFTVYAYSFNFTHPSSAVTVTPSGGTAVTAAAGTTATLSCSGLSVPTALFTVSGAAYAATSAFTVTVRRSITPANQKNLFITKGGVPYRIPALAQAQNGNLIAVTDYRYSGQDIGFGAVDIKARLSKDGGNTWEPEFLLADGTGINGDNTARYAYGDAALVADRTSNKVMMMCVGGRVVFFNGTKSNPPHVVRFLSDNGGETWDAGTVQTQQIYDLFEADGRDSLSSVFFTSGRILQSSYVKTGDYYRVYSALCARLSNPNGTSVVYVVYSDDFGATWKLLGGAGVIPCSAGDEAKCEELPDGSLVLSVRTTGGRIFNTFTFTDAEAAEGYWGKQIGSNASNNGVVATSNACNGELLIVAAKRLSDDAPTYVALQSVPFGSGRTKVGVFYKELDAYDDYKNSTAIAANWTKGLQISAIGSAYSTMIRQQDDSIGFFYEESTYGYDYTMVYKKFSLEDLTDSTFTLAAESPALRAAMLTEAAEGLVAGLTVGKAVGMPTDLTAAQTALATVQSNPTYATYAALNKAIVDDTKRVTLTPNRVYVLRNKFYPTKVMTINATGQLTLVDYSNAALNQFFDFQQKDGYWTICQTNRGLYVDSLRTRAAQVLSTSNAAAAGVFAIHSNLAGESLLRNIGSYNPVYECLHGTASSTVVDWMNSAEASLWQIEPVDSFSVAVTAGRDGRYYTTAYLPFAYTTSSTATAYKVTATDADSVQLAEVGVVPSRAGVVLVNTVNKPVVLYPTDATADDLSDNLLGGVLQDSTLTNGSEHYLLGYRTTAGMAFYPVTTTKKLLANKAFLYMAGGPQSYYRLDGDTLTGIASPTLDAGAETEYYDLQGRRAARPANGLYITGDGRKVYVK